MHGDDNKHNVKEMECKKKRKNARDNKMHEHNIKEMGCKRKEQNVRGIKCMKMIINAK